MEGNGLNGRLVLYVMLLVEFLLVPKLESRCRRDRLRKFLRQTVYTVLLSYVPLKMYDSYLLFVKITKVYTAVQTRCNALQCYSRWFVISIIGSHFKLITRINITTTITHSDNNRLL